MSARSRKPRVRKEKKPTDRMGVFLCRCGGSVDGRVDLESVRDHISSLEEVDHCEIMDFPCSKEGRESMVRILGEKDMDRFMMGGCSPKVVLGRFMDVARESGINPFMVEIANIREHCSMVHEGPAATDKARDLVEAAVAKCDLLVPAPYSRGTIEETDILVYGNGMSAVVAADEVVSEGGRCHLVMPFDPQRLQFNYHDGILPDHLEAMMTRVIGSEMVNLHGRTTVEGFQGEPGNFRAMLVSRDDREEVGCGAAIIAWEADEVPPENVDGDIVVTQADLEQMLNEGGVPKRTVMITMFEKESPYPGRITHIEAIRNALRIREREPEAEVTIVVRDVLAFGMRELDYRDAQFRGVRFVRTEAFPHISDGSPVKILVEDTNLGEVIELEADLVVTTTWSQPLDSFSLSRVFGVPVDEEGFFVPVQVKLKPTASIREGVLLCGTGVESRTPSEVVLEARSAASRAMALVRSELESGGAVAEVDPELCSACLTCLRSCPFSAPFIGDTGKAEIDIGLCQGCGICAGVCPSKAIQLFTCTDDQIEAQTGILSRGVER
jgi:heterodisulfide reductase subunit A